MSKLGTQIAAMSLDPPAGSERDRDNKFYRLLGGGAKLRLLETFLELKLPELLGGRKDGSPMKAVEICAELGLDMHRGWKFLHLLSLSGLLTETNGTRGEETAEYSMSPDCIEFFGANGDVNDSYFFRELVLFWRYLNDMKVSLVDVLRGADLPDMVQWPPATPEAAKHLEKWMTVTAKGACDTLLASGAMKGAQTMLDVGGGDGTIAIAVVKASAVVGGDDEEEEEIQDLSNYLTTATVFNLPASAELATERIAGEELSPLIDVVVGDFLKDELPRGKTGAGYDRVLFSRVLTDWTPNVCKMLLEKARRALAPGGRLVINEAFQAGNEDYFIAWEYRYIYYDTFGRVLFKPVETYLSLLEETGFKVLSVSPMLDNAFYSVIVAEAVQSAPMKGSKRAATEAVTAEGGGNGKKASAGDVKK